MPKDPEGTQPPPEGPPTKDQKELDDLNREVHKRNPDADPTR
jgi:hypothetical protein